MLVPYFVPGRWEDMMDEEKERVLALGGTDQDEGAEGEESEDSPGVTHRCIRPFRWLTYGPA